MGIDGGSKVFAGDGRALTLDRSLRSGGAGSIHRIVGISDLVAKIYHPQVDRTIYERKVEAMLSFVPDLPDITEGGVREVQIAWPRDLLRDAQRRFVGFTMPLLDFAASIELECVLQERQARAQGLPTGLGAKVTLAANLTSLIAELHRQGHYVVDLKPVNLRFYRRSLHVAMLDCDGYSIKGDGRRFSAPQFTPEYLAPEFQREGLSAGGDLASNEQQQDRFALAVIVFQLLNFGIHPFTGRPASKRIPSDIPGRIAHGCYAYGLRANPEMAPNPASGHTAMPPELRQLFDRAFTAKGVARPSADEWVSRLRAYGRRSTGMLIACRADGSHQHFAGHPCGACARKAVLTRASSVVRAPTKKAPKWTRRRPAPPAPSPPPPLSAPLPRSSTPSFAPNPLKPLWYLGAFFVGLLFFLLSQSPPPRSKTTPTVVTTTTEGGWPPRNEWAKAATLDEVLAAARGSDKETIGAALARLPNTRRGPRQEECRAATAAWREKVRWTKDDPTYARDRLLLYLYATEFPGEPCGGLSFLAPEIVRTQYLCRMRLQSPGANPGIGDAECLNNNVIQAGVDTLGRALVYGPALDPFLWERMGEAFLLSDEYENAKAAFVISGLLYPRTNLDERVNSTGMIEEGWLHAREEVLAAAASARIRLMNGESLSNEINAKLHAPLPAEPRQTKSPARKPRH